MPDFDPIAEARRNWTAHWGDEPVPSMSAVTSIMRVQQILLARLNDELKPFDLTFPRYEALMLLYYCRRGALPLGKMGDRLQVHRTSVTNIIDGLERSGFVTREPHERDRRTTLAAITPRGREVARPRRPASSTGCGSGPSRSRRADLDAITAMLERLRADADGFGQLATPAVASTSTQRSSRAEAQHGVGDPRGAQAVRERPAGRRAVSPLSTAA